MLWDGWEQGGGTLRKAGATLEGLLVAWKHPGDSGSWEGRCKSRCKYGYSVSHHLILQFLFTNPAEVEEGLEEGCSDIVLPPCRSVDPCPTTRGYREGGMGMRRAVIPGVRALPRPGPRDEGSGWKQGLDASLILMILPVHPARVFLATEGRGWGAEAAKNRGVPAHSPKAGIRLSACLPA